MNYLCLETQARQLGVDKSSNYIAVRRLTPVPLFDKVTRSSPSDVHIMARLKYAYQGTSRSTREVTQFSVQKHGADSLRGSR